MIQDNIMRFDFVAVYYEGRSSLRTLLKIEFLLQKCLKISLLVNFTLLLMVKAVVHLAQAGEDRFPAGPRALLSWFQSGRKRIREL